MSELDDAAETAAAEEWLDQLDPNVPGGPHRLCSDVVHMWCKMLIGDLATTSHLLKQWCAILGLNQ
jgi:hypothetical protein